MTEAIDTHMHIAPNPSSGESRTPIHRKGKGLGKVALGITKGLVAHELGAYIPGSTSISRLAGEYKHAGADLMKEPTGHSRVDEMALSNLDPGNAVNKQVVPIDYGTPSEIQIELSDGRQAKVSFPLPAEHS